MPTAGQNSEASQSVQQEARNTSSPFASPIKIPSTRDWFFTILAGSIIATLSLYLIVFLAAEWLNPPLNGILSYTVGILPPVPSKHLLSTSEKEVVGNLLKNGTMIGMDTIVSGLMNYYNTIITILLGLVAAVCAVSFMYIKSASLLHSEEVAEHAGEKAIKTYLKSTDFRDLMDLSIQRRTSDKIAEIDSLIEDVTLTFGVRTDIEQRLALIERRIAQLDTHEEGDGEIIPPQASPSVES